MQPADDILQYVGSTVKTVDSLVSSIQIAGHTAQVGQDTTTNFFAWELSSDRAITVLKFLVQKCSLPQSKMTVSGYSHYVPVATNDTEAGRATNRRVEIKVSKIKDTSPTTSAASSGKQ
jgi:chemotaxis protein MotB